MALIDPSDTSRRGLFVSDATVTGASAAEVDIAHGLGRIPAGVIVSILDTQDHTDIAIVLGTHDATNVKFTPTYSGGTGVLTVQVMAG